LSANNAAYGGERILLKVFFLIRALAESKKIKYTPIFPFFGSEAAVLQAKILTDYCLLFRYKID
jgi:hypothetical protein